MASETASRTGTQAVQRALAVLRVLEDGPPTMSLTELAKRTKLSPSTTHRLLRALCDAGLLRQDAGSDHYGFGPRLVVLGERAAVALGLSGARPILEELARTTGESVNLGLREGDDVLVLVCIASSQRLRFDQEAGARVPVHASAMGKALLAFDPGVDDTLDALPALERLTGTTITTRSALRAELDSVRSRGWAINDEEREPGVRTVAAPVLDGNGTARAAVAVQGPAVRMDDERIALVAPLVQEAAAAVAGQLGARHAP
jgi:IclR family acetate operon transcriptional repressor